MQKCHRKQHPNHYKYCLVISNEWGSICVLHVYASIIAMFKWCRLYVWILFIILEDKLHWLPGSSLLVSVSAPIISHQIVGVLSHYRGQQSPWSFFSPVLSRYVFLYKPPALPHSPGLIDIYLRSFAACKLIIYTLKSN